MDYFEARENRLKVITEHMKKFCNELLLVGYKVYISKLNTRGFITYAKIVSVDGEKALTFGFEEVPYRWYIDRGNREIDYGFTIDNIPTFTTDDIVISLEDFGNSNTDVSYLREVKEEFPLRGELEQD